mgnify:FL=1
MNYEECTKATIEDSVIGILKRLPDLAPEDRFHLMMEWFEVVACPIDVDDVLIVPNFQNEVEK